jgi:hypothetical protein
MVRDNDGTTQVEDQSDSSSELSNIFADAGD